ncbi:M28 family peptidase [Helicobacter anatolicus]|uniref:M28 family peptidase n=1 Tax=Helicobacter anatolicus TaxID=2905874 RepID=UPI001E49BE14|nr:M28 family peptidase [Helicobacter anatolicus]MCE3039200.1 M28 family peptidase [Helicobacter anatolicus]
MQNTLEIFKKISEIPHSSGDTKQLMQWIVEVLKPHVDKIKIDTAGNIYCKKGEPKICLQAHYDMVLVGEKKPLVLQEENHFLRAKDSSLGADNGIGVALMIKMLQQYNQLECLFTNDEEIGLIGANSLNIPIKSQYLLNLDSEFFGSIVVGCAGGFVLENTLSMQKVTKKYRNFYKIIAQNYLGGHSGIDIKKGRKNPIIDFFTFMKDKNYGILFLCAGEFNNAIPTKLEAWIAYDENLDFSLCDKEKTGEFFIERLEYREDYQIYSKENLQNYILSLQHGVWEEDSFGVCNSLNVAMLRQDKENMIVTLMGRANYQKGLEENLKIQQENCKKYTLDSKLIEFYLPWEQDIKDYGEFLSVVKQAFFWRHVCVETLHAGLECGVLLERFKKMGLGEKMALSIGPTIFYPHSKNEVLDLWSMEEFENILEKIVRKYAET